MLLIGYLMQSTYSSIYSVYVFSRHSDRFSIEYFLFRWFVSDEISRLSMLKHDGDTSVEDNSYM